MNDRIATLLLIATLFGAAGCAKSGGPSATSMDAATSAELAKVGAPVYPNAALEGDAAVSDATASGKRNVTADLVTSDDFATVNAWYKAHVGAKLVYTDQGSPGAPMAVYQSENLEHVLYGKVILTPASGGKSGTEILLYGRED